MSHVHRIASASALLAALGGLAVAQGRQPAQLLGHMSTEPVWTADSNQVGALLGLSCSWAGDVNGDGFSDVVVGAALFEAHRIREGRAFAYYGSARGLAASPSWTADGNHSHAAFGSCVSGAGDVNGDGYGDVIIAADQFSVPGPVHHEDGAAYLYLGSNSGLGVEPSWVTFGVRDAFGRSLATAGDVNGDGYSDVIVGGPFFSNDQTAEGRACVYLGSALGLATSPAWTAEGDQDSAHLGMSVSTAGDVNGDGCSDVIVGAPEFDNGQNDEGRAFVYLGSSSGLETSPAWTIESDQANASMGGLVSTAGDVNGDGFSDVAVTTDQQLYVFLGSSVGLAATPAWMLTVPLGKAIRSASTAGDVDRDGYGDFVVGSGETATVGRIVIYLGSPSGLANAPSFSCDVDGGNGSFGKSVSTAGDTDGNGFGEVLVGSPEFDNGEEAEGQAFVFSWSTKIRPRRF